MKKIRALADLDVEGEILKAGTILEVVDVVNSTIVVKLPDSECCYAMSSDALETGFEAAEN